MHELSLATAMLEQVERIASDEHASEVLSLTVRLGALAGVDAEAFEFAFPLAAQGTPFEKTLLTLEQVPAEVACRDCRGVSSPDVMLIRCAHCGSSNVEIVGGREFLIVRMEVR